MKQIIILFCFLLVAGKGFAQGIPAGYCGVQFTYDDAGNRIKRAYVCTGAKMASELAVANDDKDKVEMIYPNPTAGRVSVYFSKGLDGSVISVLNMQGSLFRQVRGMGIRMDLDLTDLPSGMYIIKVDKVDEQVTKKIIKIDK